VAILRNGAIVAAVSTNSAPGLVYYIDPKGTKMSQLLEKNSEMGGRPVVASSDLQQNQQIIEAVNAKQKSIREDNAQAFQESVKAPLTELLLQDSDSPLVKDQTQKVVEYMANTMAKKGYIDQKTFEREIKDHLMDPVKERKIQIQTEQREIENIAVMRKAKNPNKNKILAIEKQLEEAWGVKIDQDSVRRLEILTGKKESLQTEYDSLHEYTNKLLRKEVNTNKFWTEHFKDFPKKLTLWDVTNCGEPHALMAMSRLGKTFFINICT
jgi:hypothetical protein